MIPDTNMNEYTSKAQGNLNTVLGALGTAALLGNGGCGGGFLGNLFGGGCNTNRELAAKDAQIARLETEVKLRDANIYTDSKIADVYERLSNRMNCMEAQIGEQRVYNATNNSALACLQGQVAQLFSLTKLGIPNASLCPGVPPVYLKHTAPAAA
jgi:hypothetical protein